MVFKKDLTLDGKMRQKTLSGVNNKELFKSGSYRSNRRGLFSTSGLKRDDDDDDDIKPSFH